MNKLTALIEAAKEDANLRNPDALNGYGDTILELCTLLEKAEGAAKAFKTARDQADQYGHLVEASSDIAEAYYQADRMNDEALAAIKQWKKQT